MTATVERPAVSSDDQELGPVIVGPSALAGDPRRFVRLTFTLAVTEFKLRFFGSVLGYFWQLARPLMLFGVLYFVFTEFVRVGGPVPHYPVVLLTNIVLFTFFMEGTGNSVASVLDREGIVRKIHFPRMAIPASVVLTASFNFALNLVVIMIFAVSSGVHPGWSWLFLIPATLALLTLTLGVAMLLSSAYVRYRDIRPIWEVFSQALFYATPVIYAVETIHKPPTVIHLLMCNPLAVILVSVRHWVIDPNAPTAADMIGGASHLLIPLGLTLAICVYGFWYFNRAAPSIAEEL